MVDDFRSLKDTIFKSVFTAVSGDGDDNPRTSFLREIVGTLASIAGKGKDEIVQIISREIGLAVASALKEPLTGALQGKKLRLTIEFVPDTGKAPAAKRKARSKAK